MTRTIIGNGLRALVWTDGALAFLDNPRAIDSRRDGTAYLLAALALVPIGILASFAWTVWWEVWTTDGSHPRGVLGASILTALVVALVVAGAAKLAVMGGRRRPAPGWRTVLQFDTSQGLARWVSTGAAFPIGEVTIEAKIERREKSAIQIFPRPTLVAVDVTLRVAGQRHQLRFTMGKVPKPFSPYPLLPEIDAALQELSALGFGIRVEQPLL